MSITETVLVFVGIPAVVIGTVFALVYARGSSTSVKRYRPGRPYTAAPVWYLANKHGAAPAPDGHGSRAVTSVPDGELATVHYGETGGASDSW